jgi:DNA-binding XRE family transcriptional regulator
MKNNHVGPSFFDDVKEWEKSPTFRKAVEEHKEKAKLAMLLKQVREKEDLSQLQLAKKAHVAQAVIARIEGLSSNTVPGLALYNKILNSIGYTTTLVAKKKNKVLHAAFN